MIRICLKCNAYYADDSLAFCLVDGTPLVNVDPTSDNWTEGFRVTQEKENTMRKQKRKLKWQRVLMTVISMMIVTTVVLVVVANTLIYLKPTTPTPTLSPSPTPLLSPTPTPTSSPTPTPTPTPSPSPSPTPSPTQTSSRVYKISGYVMDAGKPLGGVSIVLGGTKTATTTTDAKGFYTFSPLPAGGSYTITPARAKTNFTPRSHSINNLTRDGSADFSGLVQLAFFKISGRVTDRSKPLTGVNIMLNGAKTASATTDANGYYIFGGLPEGGNYTITPARKKTDFTPGSRSINNLMRDEAAHFSTLTKQDETPPQECTDADKDRERKFIFKTYRDSWQRKIEGERTSIAGNATGVFTHAQSLDTINRRGKRLRRKKECRNW